MDRYIPATGAGQGYIVKTTDSALYQAAQISRHRHRDKQRIEGAVVHRASMRAIALCLQMSDNPEYEWAPAADTVPYDVILRGVTDTENGLFATLEIPSAGAHSMGFPIGEPAPLGGFLGKSSVILTVARVAGLVQVVMVNGSVYWYQGVPDSVYKDWESSSSRGKFYNREIKGKYPALDLVGMVESRGSEGD